MRTFRPWSRCCGGACWLAAACYWLGPAVTAGAGDGAAGTPPGLYRLTGQDTLRDVAARFLGGAEFLPELLLFNQVDNPGRLRAGDLVALPGPERSAALEALSAADLALARAAAAQAETYAREEFRLARDTVAAARRARAQAGYDKARALACLGAARADDARRLADARAPAQQDGKVRRMCGIVEISSDTGQTWRAAQAGACLAVSDRLRTAGQSRAEVELADGSVFQVLESSEFQIVDFLFDPRMGWSRSRLRVILGDILGRVKPRAREDAEFEVESGAAAIAIRGTELRVGQAADETATLSVLDGQTVLRARQAEVAVPANHGSYVPRGRPPAPPVALLPAPRLRAPRTPAVTTAVQAVTWQWDEWRDQRGERYRLEIARDPTFVQIVQNKLSPPDAAGLVSDVLPGGVYYWRVTCVDRHGIVGVPGPTRALTIAPDLVVMLVPSPPSVEWNGRRVLGPGGRVEVRPAGRETSAVVYEYSINDGPFRPGEGPIALRRDGPQALTVRAVGAGGDRGPAARGDFVLDATPPRVRCEVSPIRAHSRRGRVVTVTLAADDDTAAAAIEFSLDGRAFEPYRRPLELSAYAEHRLTARARDVVGNRSPDQTFTVAGEWVPRTR